MYKTSYISRLVHGLDYRMINETNMEDHQLNEYIQKMIKAMDIREEFKVVEAKRIPGEKYRIFLTFSINDGPAISMGIGYSTKKTTYHYEGKTIEHFERFGNCFSTMHTPEGVAVLSPEISEAGLKEVAAESHTLGRQVLLDFIAWWNPGELTEENYENFIHDKNMYPSEKKCEDILKENNYAGPVLHLKDGRKVFVYCRGESQDQLVPNLEKRSFWREKYFNDLKYKIDQYESDGFRVDLPHELHTPDNNLDYTLIHEVFIEAIKYASKNHQKNLYFILETYGMNHRDLFRSYNNSVGYDVFKNGEVLDCDFKNYPAFKTYFGALRKNISGRDLEALVKDMNWLTGNFKASETDAGYLSNPDEKAVKDALADENYRRNAIALTIFLAKAGFNILFYARDLLEFSGDFNPVVGGETEGNEGKVYITHRFLTQEEFELRLKYSLEELVKNSFTYKFIEDFKNKEIAFLRMENGKVIFTVKGRGGIECVGVRQEIHFDLKNMTYDDVVSTKSDLSAMGGQVSSALAEDQKPSFVLSSDDIYRIALNTSKEGFKWAGAFYHGIYGTFKEHPGFRVEFIKALKKIIFISAQEVEGDLYRVKQIKLGAAWILSKPEFFGTVRHPDINDWSDTSVVNILIHYTSPNASRIIMESFGRLDSQEQKDWWVDQILCILSTEDKASDIYRHAQDALRGIFDFELTPFNVCRYHGQLYRALRERQFKPR
ncbi:MAG TPA: hypothetical protein DEA99_06765, partial [Candidatus Omnitrophica bacterium]|nr:hypothetical protein [Candidatus Omnitrophota bacterium]